jgi:DNA (cytosine-5)-methyltransferase 1
MTFGSVCSGIEAASEAWIPLGWTPRFVSEVEAFCCSLLKQKHPKVKNYGDFTTIGSDAGPIDVLVGGTPCQDFSVAGLRAGMAGERGNLTLEFVKLAGRLRPQWVVWENVPGVLSIDGGRAFGAFLGGLGQLGYGFAYRVLDAQHFGVPQRRRRVFVVGYFGDWRHAAAVLFERYSLSGDPAPRRESGERVAGTISARTEGGGGLGTDFDLGGGLIPETISPTLRAMEFDGSHANGGGQVAIAFDWQSGGDVRHNCSTERTSALQSCQTPAVAFNLRGREGGALPESADLASLRSASGGSSRTYVGTVAVRRLTPRECERLQGFPDDYTLITHRRQAGGRRPPVQGIGQLDGGPGHALDWGADPDGLRRPRQHRLFVA